MCINTSSKVQTQSMPFIVDFFSVEIHEEFIIFLKFILKLYCSHVWIYNGEGVSGPLSLKNSNLFNLLREILKRGPTLFHQTIFFLDLATFFF